MNGESKRRPRNNDFNDLIDHRVSASIGVVAWDGGEGLAGFIHQADEALYLAKQKGKNWVESSAGETAGSGFASGSMDDA